MDRWVGKVAVVSGASSGIGKAIAQSLVSSGMKVLGLARREEKLKELAVILKHSKGSFYYMRCDLRKEEDILNAFQYAEKQLGSVDVLINNAGLGTSGSLLDVNTEEIRKILETNVLAAAICIREAVKVMRQQKNECHIVNINSVFGLNATYWEYPTNIYPASKFALKALNECIKQEIQQNKYKIRVTSIHPGLVKTEMLEPNSSSEYILQQLPFLQVKDIAESVLFSLSASPTVQIEEIVLTSYTK